jgi:hypothetical protein
MPLTLSPLALIYTYRCFSTQQSQPCSIPYSLKAKSTTALIRSTHATSHVSRGLESMSFAQVENKKPKGTYATLNEMRKAIKEDGATTKCSLKNSSPALDQIGVLVGASDKYRLADPIPAPAEEKQERKRKRFMFANRKGTKPEATNGTESDADKVRYSPTASASVYRKDSFERGRQDHISVVRR